MYKVSILVPVFNAANCIERCVRSLFEQSYANLEYVFVDDCSPDNSVLVLNTLILEYPERKNQVRLVRNESNRGVAASRNIAIENATGEFVAFVDADDWLELNAVDLLVEKQQSEKADIVYGNALMHAPGGLFELKEGVYEDKHKMMLCYSRFTPGYTMVLWRRLIRRSLFLDNAIWAEEGLNYAEDKNLLARLGFYSKLVSYLDSIVYHYNRETDDSLVGTASKTEFPLSVHLQEVGNMQIVVDFFKERSDVYFSESSRAFLRFLRGCMNGALSASSKRGFNAMVDLINNANPVFWGEIGWDSWKRILYGNYYYMKYFPKIKRKVKRFLGC